MKRKRPAPQPAPVQAAAPRPVPAPPVYGRLFVGGFTVLLFLAMTVQTVPVSVLLAAVSLAACAGRRGFARFASRLSLPVWGFLAFLALNLAGSLYTGFGAYAYREFGKILASGALGLLFLARGRRENADGFLWGFSAVSAAIGLLCVDAACQGLLFRGFTAAAAALGDPEYQTLEQIVDTGARFNGIYNDANLTGSLTALGILTGICLIRTRRTRRARLAAGLLTGVSGVAFLVAMSRGAILCFGVALIAYLLAAGKEERIGLFLTLAAAGIAIAVCGVASIFLLSGGSALGTLAALPCGALLWLLDEFAGRKLAVKLAGHVKAMALALACVAAVLAAGAAAALTMTEPFVFTDGNVLYRGADVESGETYSLSGDWDGGDEITVLIYGSTREQELIRTTETYYNGPLRTAAFTVPEDVDRVLMQFRGPAGMEIRGVSLSDGTEIPLAYTLLPDSIVNRFQKNLFEDYSFLQRVQYDIDGWELFTRSPLLGHGLGATEGLLTSVQPFFYESRYLHNHLLQVMDETGLLGLASFLAFVLGAAWLLVRRLRAERDPLAAMLLACLVMMNLHGLMEITFSIRMYQCAAFFLLLLAVACYGRPAGGRKVIGLAGFAAAEAWMLVSALLLGGSLLAQRQSQELDVSGMTSDAFIETMEKLDRMDVYNDQLFKVNLMGNALQAGGGNNESTAARCARELRETGDYDACYYVAAYYYLPLGQMDNFFRVIEEGLAQERSNAEAWNSAVNLCGQAFARIRPEDTDEFADGLREIGEAMDRANAELLVPIALDAANQALLDCVRDESLTGEALYGAISAALEQIQAAE